MFRIVLSVLAVLIGAQMASAETPQHPKKTPRHDTEQGQIACSKIGCRRIPPNCHPEQSYDWNGMPTGYDQVVCR
jgi:hypothetical protein